MYEWEDPLCWACRTKFLISSLHASTLKQLGQFYSSSSWLSSKVQVVISYFLQIARPRRSEFSSEVLPECELYHCPETLYPYGQYVPEPTAYSPLCGEITYYHGSSWGAVKLNMERKALLVTGVWNRKK
ncbi:hypothetical protein R1flu_026996 [Riccia fluitans]|uniref:Uncharacterized protein n=1 Tax=Riccia fluitans TaxID=41844 RepID=A0ABD1XHI5_9MARC